VQQEQGDKDVHTPQAYAGNGLALNKIEHSPKEVPVEVHNKLDMWPVRYTGI
jgi:hypothetical protein